MLTHVQKLLRLPVFEDESEFRIARLLSLILPTFAIIALGYTIAFPILTSLGGTYLLPITGSMLVVTAIAAYILRQSRVRLATGFFLLANWAILTCAGLLVDGVRGVAVNYLAGVILLAGLLLGGRAAFLFAGLSVLSGLVMVYAESIGVLPQPLIHSSSAILWVRQSAYFIFTAIMLYMAAHGIEDAIQRARNAAIERLRMEQALAESEKIHEITLTAISDAVLITKDSGELVYVCPNVSVIFGYSKQEVIEMKTIFGLIPDLRIDLDELRVQGEIRNRDMEIEDKDRVKHTVLVTQKQVAIAGGTILYTCRDITERRQAEQKVQAMEKDREVLQFKERFLSAVSHEFRVPLAVITTSKDLLESYYDRLTPEKRQHHYQQIQIQTQKMVEMLNDLLTTNQIQSGMHTFDPQIMNLEAFCRNLIEQVNLVDKGAHDILFTFVETPDEIRMDEKLLAHILLNLLSNAIKYSPADSAIEFSVSYDNNRAVFRISDKGIGIPAEDQTRLFESFHRASNVKEIQGTGLGLVVVKNSVEAHEGTITFESKEGEGTTFEVRLPYR